MFTHKPLNIIIEWIYNTIKSNIQMINIMNAVISSWFTYCYQQLENMSSRFNSNSEAFVLVNTSRIHFKIISKSQRNIFSVLDAFNMFKTSMTSYPCQRGSNPSSCQIEISIWSLYTRLSYICHSTFNKFFTPDIVYI